MLFYDEKKREIREAKDISYHGTPFYEETGPNISEEEKQLVNILNQVNKLYWSIISKPRKKVDK